MTRSLAHVLWASEVSGVTQRDRSVLEGFGPAEAEAGGQWEDVRDSADHWVMSSALDVNSSSTAFVYRFLLYPSEGQQALAEKSKDRIQAGRGEM